MVKKLNLSSRIVDALLIAEVAIGTLLGIATLTLFIDDPRLWDAMIIPAAVSGCTVAVLVSGYFIGKRGNPT